MQNICATPVKPAARKAAEKGESHSALDGVTRALPALLKAQKIQKKASKVGFEWPDPNDVLDKLEEEIAEMRAAIAKKDKENQAEELGDILFLLANYGRMLGINTEEALRQCIHKFERRFRGMEHDNDLSKLSLEQMESAWQDQKKKILKKNR